MLALLCAKLCPMTEFVHLHVHSHYSMLDGMSKVPDLVDKCMNNGMRAMALTDHGCMFGIKDFCDYVGKVNGAPKKKIKDCKEDIEKTTDEAKLAELNEKLKKLEADAAAFVPFKPIIGTEAYCARRTLHDKDKTYKETDPETGRDYIPDRNGWHLILLAKNKTGYLNLCKLASQAYVDGFYGKPRIDKNILEKYHEGLIVCSACLGGEIPQKIIAGDIKGAEEAVMWFKNIFGDDYYIELQRHKTDKPNASYDTFKRQEHVNPILVDLARKCGVKIICTNDVHFVEENHGEAHERLVCLSTGQDYDDPNRSMMYTKQEWLKTPDEMAAIFPDYPEALANTIEIANKVEMFSIDSGPIMPKYDIPEEFGTEEQYRRRFTDEDLFNEFTRDEKGQVVLSQKDAEKKIKNLGGYEKLYRIKLEADYLSKLAWEGAAMRYGAKLNWDGENNRYEVELEQRAKDQIVFELHIMKTMGFPGYFLIVQDYIRAAREELGMFVGPGRGSAAGSVVAYCLKITDIDPLTYDLLFERFLNPDRISLPDIDVDFEDTGKIIEWVTKKYGAEKVARIITYGTMATKSALADVARVQKVPLEEVNRLKKLVPDKFDDYIDPETGKTFASSGKKPPKVKLKNCFKYVPELKNARFSENRNISTMCEYAEQLEDTNRQVGIHACGVIIGADDLTNFAPMCTVKDKETDRDVLVTQYDGHVIESVGLIKMDFLGLITLTLIKTTIQYVKKTRGIDVDIDHIPLDDELTYKLFGEGRTIGVFQFESPGMQKYLKELKPTVITDLIAMNALYRPGPIAYIPTFINRKHGREEIKYDLPIMEKYLGDTYGVTVYQEQVMLLSRLLAGFTRGQSDSLRKAMGKKIFAMLEQLKPKFIEGALKNPHIRDGLKEEMSDEKLKETLQKIWKDWESFASYAFNKSHAACYAWVAYQTGYLKAHFPAEYLAANLTISKDSISEVQKFMEECKVMKIQVLGPDVNESELNFTVTPDNEIRFGLGGIKGVGEGAVDAIVSEREKNGPYTDFMNFLDRCDLHAINRKAIEVMIKTGCFDNFGSENTISRSTLIANMERAVEYAENKKQQKLYGQVSLFEEAGEKEFDDFKFDLLPEWTLQEKLASEKELIGFYLSGHPLDEYRDIIEKAETFNVATPDRAQKDKSYTIVGMLKGLRPFVTKKEKTMAFGQFEDINGEIDLTFFPKTWEKVAGRVQIDRVYGFTGKVDTSRDTPSFLIDDVIAPEELKEKSISEVHIQLQNGVHSERDLQELKDFLFAQQGNCCVYFHIEAWGKPYIVMANQQMTVPSTSDFLAGIKEQPYVENVWRE
ncbi:MAG: DNA polymerase III subunit alpha [Treponemataceae bacterium]|nr:DNA polymerase III subunit alpha [Treponemataceae bacterium]